MRCPKDCPWPPWCCDWPARSISLSAQTYRSDGPSQEPSSSTPIFLHIGVSPALHRPTINKIPGALVMRCGPGSIILEWTP